MAADDDLRLAFSAADLAAGLAPAHFRAGVSVTPEDDGSPVTAADDLAVERLLRETSSWAQPGDAFPGEEFGRLGESERVWVLDPIDGTGSSRGDPNWRIHVALEVRGATEVALVASPVLGRCWWATRGGGSFESSWPRRGSWTRRLAVSTTAPLAGAVLEALDDESRARLPPGAQRPPPSPLPLVELVRGEIDGFLAERHHAWDHAPWILIVEEAGGRFTDRTGGRASDRGGGLYSNAALHDPLLAALHHPARP